jgi:hypothetical protein
MLPALLVRGCHGSLSLDLTGLSQYHEAADDFADDRFVVTYSNSTAPCVQEHKSIVQWFVPAGGRLVRLLASLHKHRMLTL